MASATTGTVPGQRPYFHRVETLRGLGALTVAAYHMTGGTLHGVSLLPNIPWDSGGVTQDLLRRIGLVLLPGHAMLMMFFVISGFVLRLSLARGPQKLVTAAGK